MKALDQEVKSGSAAKRKVEPDDTSLVASVAKKPATSVADATIGHNVKETFIRFGYFSTLGRKDEDMEVELAKHFLPGSNEFKKALEKVSWFLQTYFSTAGESDDSNSREVYVKSVFTRDGRLITSFVL